MAKLGVSKLLTLEENKKIVAKKYIENPYLTVKQVQFLKRFSWVGHEKGNINCKCLACELERFLKSASLEELKELAGLQGQRENLNEISLKAYI